MDIDAAALWYSTRSETSYAEAIERGVVEELFVGVGKTAWKFLAEYHKKHNGLPGIGLIAENSGCAVHPPEEGDETNLSFLVEQLHQRAIYRALKYGTTKITEAIEADKQDEAVSEVLRLAEHLKTRRFAQSALRSLSQVAPEVLEMYERTKRGETGIPYPWPTMTQMTMGLWPQTLTFFVARPGVGKTWTAVNIALNAWLQGHRVLFVSPELGRVELGERILSMHGRFPYGDMVQATLGDHGGEKKLRALVDELVHSERAQKDFIILDDEDHLSPPHIEAATDTIAPALTVLDSIYMMRVEQGKVKKGAGSKGGRYDRILDTIDWARSYSRSRRIPVLGISQMSRDAKKGGKGGEAVKRGQGTGGLEDALAMTDTLLWDVHNLFGIWQDEDMKLDKQLLYVPLKIRRSAMASKLFIRWDMESMDFSELGTKVPEGSRNSHGGGDDSDFGGDGMPY